MIQRSLRRISSELFPVAIDICTLSVNCSANGTHGTIAYGSAHAGFANRRVRTVRCGLEKSIEFCPISIALRSRRVSVNHSITKYLADFDAASWENARKDSRFQSLSLYTCQSGQQRRGCHQISAKPSAIMTSLFDDVELIANFKGQVGWRSSCEWVRSHGEGYTRQGSPGHID